jgi:nicotinamidase-related amidase/type 1 glutamine amidotransferase
MSSVAAVAQAQSLSLDLELRSKVETSPGSGRFHTEFKSAQWDPSQTAIILCDMWDAHHSVTAVRRLTEFAPRVDDVIAELRNRGAAIIHAPSDCMDAYRDHPARLHAVAAPVAGDALPDIAAWCHRIPGEERARYPIDQSDGGEDEDAWENEQWAEQLTAQGRNPGTPWKMQTPLIEIADSDYIAAEGDIVWNVLRDRNIRHVILAGVHTNMCVLGRPFGLRQMVRAGLDTTLLRDCTDVMYNPARWPYVSHFTGLDLVVDHIEANVCPTLTSNQIVGGKPFRFSSDRRPRLLMVIAEDEYESARTLPDFARRFLSNDFNVNYAFGSDTERHDIRGLQQVNDADVLLVSVRRRALRPADKQALMEFVAAGKPVIGIRTASHAFAPGESDSIPADHVSWPEFDATVLGGNYSGHHGNKGPDGPASFTWIEDRDGVPHPLLRGLPDGKWTTTSWLYKTSPLAPGALVLLRGEVEGRQPSEPVAWSFTRSDSGRSFYTSLGHSDDFADTGFQQLLVNAVYWAADLNAPDSLPEHPDQRRQQELQWSPIELKDVPGKDYLRDAPMTWLRTLVHAPAILPSGHLTLVLPPVLKEVSVFFNGQAVERASNSAGSFNLARELWQPGQLNLITLQCLKPSSDAQQPEFVILASQAPVFKLEEKTVPLDGPWQCAATGVDFPPNFGAFPIPPQFGAPTDLIQNWPFE